MAAEREVAVERTRAALEGIRVRIERACEQVGRDPADVILVGASKRQPASLLAAFYAAGLCTFGENRVQEAEEKKPLVPPGADWHLIGPLQSNKARRAVELFSTIHSVDRLKIARVLDREAMAGRVHCFVEVNLGGEESKHGFSLEATPDAVSEMLELPNLELGGLMAIPPPVERSEAARPWFRKLRLLSERMQGRFPGRFGRALSMGMSSDFEVAIEEGATHVRIGTALFGERPAV